MYNCNIIEDSISNNVRLTTMVVTFPRIILAEFNTHRRFSRNSASSRAIPTTKMIKMVKDNPFIPKMRAVNPEGGMQPIEMSDNEREICTTYWEDACKNATLHAEDLHSRGCAKEIVNRLLEPFMWHTVIVTSTEWENFFSLRCDSNAQEEIRTIATLIRDVYYDPKYPPIKKSYHTPFYGQPGDDEGFAGDTPMEYEEYRMRISAARCARVSYLQHDTGTIDIEKDKALANRLQVAGHMSPFEHCAYSAVDVPLKCITEFVGNFRAPWVQYRKTMTNEERAYTP